MAVPETLLTQAIHQMIEEGDGRQAANRIVRLNFPLLTDSEISQTENNLTSSTVAMGDLDNLLSRPDITEILVSGPDRVWIERAGQLVRIQMDISEHEIRRLIERIVVPLGERIDSSCPVVDARLPDGSRVHAIIPPLAVDGSCLSIRKFAKKQIPLREFGSALMCEFIQHLVDNRYNVLIAGATSAGKTTFLGSMAGSISDTERIVTVEDSAELRIDHPHVVRLESRRNNSEGIGEFTLRDLVKQSLRMRPDRLIVGEFRGAEAFDVLQAMNTGHDGSLTTCHANSPIDALRRVESMAMTAGVGISGESVRQQIASVIDFVVFLRRVSGGRRQVAAISEVTGNEQCLGVHDLTSGGRFVRQLTRPPRLGW